MGLKDVGYYWVVAYTLEHAKGPYSDKGHAEREQKKYAKKDDTAKVVRRLTSGLADKERPLFK
jgi:hypothetical protein